MFEIKLYPSPWWEHSPFLLSFACYKFFLSPFSGCEARTTFMHLIGFQPNFCCHRLLLLISSARHSSLIGGFICCLLHLSIRRFPARPLRRTSLLTCNIGGLWGWIKGDSFNYFSLCFPMLERIRNPFIAFRSLIVLRKADVCLLISFRLDLHCIGVEKGLLYSCIYIIGTFEVSPVKLTYRSVLIGRMCSSVQPPN